MEIFGIGPLELLFILLLMLIVLGPKDMVKTGQRLGRMIRNLVRSPAWNAMMNTSRELREIPTRLVRESELEEEVTEISKLRKQVQLRDIPGQIIQNLSETETLTTEKDPNKIRPVAHADRFLEKNEATQEFTLPPNGSGLPEDVQENGKVQGE